MTGLGGWQLAGSIFSAVVSLLTALIVYRFTRRQFLRSNLERWLDCVRDDVAEFVALSGILCSPELERALGGAAAADLERQRLNWTKDRLALKVRLTLRLTKATSSHRRLISASEELVTATADEEAAARDQMIEAARGVVSETWARIRTEEGPRRRHLPRMSIEGDF